MSTTILAVSLIVSSALWCWIWLGERKETQWWKRRAKNWQERYQGAADRETFWMDQALRSPFHAKPKEVPRA